MKKVYQLDPDICRNVYDSREAVELYSHRYLWAVERYLARTYLAGSGTICDIASAAGRMSLPLSDLGNYDVVGFDISYNQVREAHRAAVEVGASCCFFQGDMTSIGLSTGSMDYVFVTYTSIGALTKGEDRRMALAEIRRILKPGGLAFISVWNRLWPGMMGISWLKWGVIHLQYITKRNGHGLGNRVCWENGGCVLWHYFTYSEAVKLFREMQFNIVDVVPFTGSWERNSVIKNNLLNRIFGEGLYFVLSRQE